MLPVTAIRSCNAAAPSPQRYWYGLSPWPTGQYAWRRQFDASAFHPGIPPAHAQAIQRVSPAYYVELRALDVAKNEIKQTMRPQVGTVTKPIPPRFWPFRWPNASPAVASAPDPAPQDLGALFDHFA